MPKFSIGDLVYYMPSSSNFYADGTKRLGVIIEVRADENTLYQNFPERDIFQYEYKVAWINTYNDIAFKVSLFVDFNRILARAKTLDDFGTQGHYIIKQNSPLYNHVNRQHPELKSSGRYYRAYLQVALVSPEQYRILTTNNERNFIGLDQLDPENLEYLKKKTR